MLFFLCFHLSSMKYTCNMFLSFYLSVQYYCYTYNFFSSSLFLNSLRKNKGSSGGSRRSCVVRGRNEIDSTFVAICWLLVFLAFWDLSKSTKCEAVRKAKKRLRLNAILFSFCQKYSLISYHGTGYSSKDILFKYENKTITYIIMETKDEGKRAPKFFQKFSIFFILTRRECSSNSSEHDMCMCGFW